MKRFNTPINPPLTDSENRALQSILIESLHALQGEVFRMPMIGGCNLGGVIYQVVIDDNRDLQVVENAIARIQCIDWTVEIPAYSYPMNVSIKLSCHIAEQLKGTRDELRRSLTLAAMFL